MSPELQEAIEDILKTLKTPGKECNFWELIFRLKEAYEGASPQTGEPK